MNILRNPFTETDHPLNYLEAESWWPRVMDFASRFLYYLDQMNRNDFGSFVRRYGDFNRAFAGAGLCLAGNAHLRDDIFGDENAALIAASVLAALVEEYIAPDGSRHTHRNLCNFFVTETVRAVGIAPPSEYDGTLSRIQSDIATGYGLASRNVDSELLSALGFHFATELNGVVEFTILDRVMRHRFPDLVGALESRTDKYGRNAYLWVSAHVIVEREHLAAALEARDLALKNYRGQLDVVCAEESFHNGITKFYRVADQHLFNN